MSCIQVLTLAQDDDVERFDRNKDRNLELLWR